MMSRERVLASFSYKRSNILRSRTLVCFAVLALLAVSPASAEYWGGVADKPEAGKSGNADMSILDVNLPYLAPTIFYAYAYQGLTAPNQKHYLSFYAGAVHNDHGLPKSLTKTFYQCSFWGPPHTTAVEYVAPGFWHGDEPDEGASAQLGGIHVIKLGT